MTDLNERVVVITGGSRGIGRAIAYRFAQEKPRIFFLHLDPDDADCDETLTALDSMGVQSEGYRVDVSSFKAVDTFFEDVLSRFKRIDVLINNAGITRDGLFMRMSEEDWDRVLEVNLKGVFNCSKAVVRSMVKQRRGWIVNISSVIGQIGNIGQVNYSASKAGIMALTKSLAKELAARDIHVNAIAPGFIDTGMTAVLSEKAKQRFLERVPLGRIGKAEDVAEAAYWLCSDAASYITGQVIHVNGGLYM
jgi:3-oxoacyl-[acyl-carrier protein] reductase